MVLVDVAADPLLESLAVQTKPFHHLLLRELTCTRRDALRKHRT